MDADPQHGIKLRICLLTTHRFAQGEANKGLEPEVPEVVEMVGPPSQWVLSANDCCSNQSAGGDDLRHRAKRLDNP
jgi:hypothetical protein